MSAQAGMRIESPGVAFTHQPIGPKDCAAAILLLGGPQPRCTTNHFILIDGVLTEAFLR
jgi:hypothetical protein